MDLGFAEDARAILDARFAVREKGIAGSRTVIRSSANGIRALHRGEWDSAAGLIDEAGALLAEITAALQDHPDILHAGFISDASKEYAEARITEALFRGRPVPGFADLGIDPVPFLHGLGEAVGELRRRLLDLLAEMDYPDGMTAGLRRTTDVSRSLVERSRSDLTATVVQERLREDLRRS